MKYELFAFDLDGTLLDSEGQLPLATLDFLNTLRAKARFTLVTGRSLFSARPYIEALGIEIPVVLYHGAVVFSYKGKEGFARSTTSFFRGTKGSCCGPKFSS